MIEGGLAYYDRPELEERDAKAARRLKHATRPLREVIAKLHEKYGEGPLYHEQDRVGKNGQPVRIKKYTTLREGTGLTPGKGIRDPRATRLGSFLRASALDELPQLDNVEEGSLRLFAPRALLYDHHATELSDMPDFAIMKDCLSRTKYDEWEEPYCKVGSGALSSYIFAKRLRPPEKLTNEPDCKLHARLDVRNVRNMGPLEEARILALGGLVTPPAVGLITVSNLFRPDAVDLVAQQAAKIEAAIENIDDQMVRTAA